MKKVFTLLAAAVVSASAFAAIPAKNATVATSDQATLSQVTMVKEMGAPTMKPMKAPAKAVATRDDLLGPHTFTYIWGLQGDDPYGGVLSPMFRAGELANEIIITGLPYTDVEIVATVDMNAKTLTVTKQEGWFNSNYNEMVYITPMEWTSNTSAGEKNAVVGTIEDDGSIVFPETDIICAKISQGYFFFFYAMEFKPLDYTVVDESEFESLGMGTFNEYCVNVLLKNQGMVPAQQVEVLANADRSVIVIKNPYAQQAWSQINGGFQINKTNGYIWLDVKEPECVLMRPLTACGFWLDDSEEGAAAPYWQEFYPFNSEGNMVYNEGYEVDEVMDEFMAIEAPLSTYDTEKGVINVTNMYFGLTDDPLSSYYFSEVIDGQKENTMFYEFTLPTGAVKDITVENNGVKRFFNLQGMEVKNPAAGELVIVKDGNKTSKTIVR